MGYCLNKRIGYGFSLHASTRVEEREFVHVVNDESKMLRFNDTDEVVDDFVKFCRNSYGDYLQTWGFGKDTDFIIKSIEASCHVSMRNAALTYHERGEEEFSVITSGVDVDDVEDEWEGQGLLVPALPFMGEWMRRDDAIDYAESSAQTSTDPMALRHVLLDQDIFPLHTSGYMNWQSGEYVHDKDKEAWIKIVKNNDLPGSMLSEDIMPGETSMTVGGVRDTFVKAAPHIMVATALWGEVFTQDADLWARRMQPMLHAYWD